MNAKLKNQYVKTKPHLRLVHNQDQIVSDHVTPINYGKLKIKNTPEMYELILRVNSCTKLVKMKNKHLRKVMRLALRVTNRVRVFIYKLLY